MLVLLLLIYVGNLPQLLYNNVAEAVKLLTTVQVIMVFGTKEMLGVVLVARKVVVTLSMQIVVVTLIATKISLFADIKDTVLENR
jgi:phosphate/sulfate permease